MVGTKVDKKNIPIFGREWERHSARLNAYKQVHLSRRSTQDEMSWVLYDRDDPKHASIPLDIQNADDLPRGAVVLSVDMTPLSHREAKLIKESVGDGEKVIIPPQAHAIYLTTHENVLKPMAGALRANFDKRSNTHDMPGPENQSYGISVLWDKKPEDDQDDRYHLRVPGNNHPESPVPGLRRLATGTALGDLLSRMALEFPTNIPHYHNFEDKPMFGDKNKVMSAVMADELGQEVSRRMMGISGSKEEGFSRRFVWQHDAEKNPVRAMLERVDAEAERIIAHDNERNARIRKVAPKGRDASEALDQLGCSKIAPVG